MTGVGCDVSKDWVDVCVLGKVIRVRRLREDLEDMFGQVPTGSHVALEPTGRYHRIVAECAQEKGHEVRVVNPHQFSLYMRSQSPRATTDKIAARVLARYAEREWDSIKDYKTPPENLQQLKDLLQVRETHVELRTAWKQSMSEVAGLEKSKDALKAMNKAIEDIERQILEIAQADPLFESFFEMDGVGKTLAPALLWLYRSFDFASPDQPVAFVGMDVRVRESGKYIGQRKLTKKGSAFMRRLLFCAASSLRRIPHFASLFQRHHAKGLKAKAVNMIVGRRILRAAFAIAERGARYDRAKFYTP